MSVIASDIIIYGSENMQESDSGIQGSGINLSTRVIFDSAVIANVPGTGGDGSFIVFSDGAADTGNVTITGRSTSGSINTEVIGINGIVPTTGNTVFERILKTVITDGSPTGNITIEDSTNADLVIMESGVTTVRRPFYNVVAPSGGAASSNIYYEKVFVKNTNTSNALLSAVISEGADPGGVIKFDLESAQGGSNTSTNRRTSPSGADMVGSPTWGESSNVPGTDLGVGSGIGVWLQMTLPAGASATKTTYTLNVGGSTT